MLLSPSYIHLFFFSFWIRRKVALNSICVGLLDRGWMSYSKSESAYYISKQNNLERPTSCSSLTHIFSHFPSLSNSHFLSQIQGIPSTISTQTTIFKLNFKIPIFFKKNIYMALLRFCICTIFQASSGVVGHVGAFL